MLVAFVSMLLAIFFSPLSANADDVGFAGTGHAEEGVPDCDLSFGVSCRGTSRRQWGSMTVSYPTGGGNIFHLNECRVQVEFRQKAGVSSAFPGTVLLRCSCVGTSRTGGAIRIGWLRPLGIAEELFRAMPIGRFSRSDGFFSSAVGGESSYTIPGIAVEHVSSRPGAGPEWAVGAGYPVWNGHGRLVSLALARTTVDRAELAAGLMLVHCPAFDIASLPITVDWTTVRPSDALISIGRIESGTLDLGECSIQTSATCKAGFDRFLGFGSAWSWAVRARKNDLSMSVFHGRDDGIFQLSVPVGSQHRVLRRLDACLGYDAPSVSASVTYRDDVHAPAVYGGSVQRRDVLLEVAISVRKDGAYAEFTCKDTTAWLSDGRRRSERFATIEVKLPAKGTQIRVDGRLSWARVAGRSLNEVSGFRLRCRAGAAVLQWDDSAIDAAIEAQTDTRFGLLSVRLDSRRTVTISCSRNL